MPGWGPDDAPEDLGTLREAANGAAQARRVSELVRHALSSDPPAFRLTVDVLCELNKLAMSGVLANAGLFRERSDIEIAGSRHVPPPHDVVPDLVAEACAFVNDRPELDPISTAAYVLWRICWIHPFEDGNGRTARAAAYIILSVRVGLELPGEIPLTERLKHAPIRYARALEAGDAAWLNGKLDLFQLEILLAFYVGAQLRDDPPSLPPGA